MELLDDGHRAQVPGIVDSLVHHRAPKHYVSAENKIPLRDRPCFPTLASSLTQVQHNISLIHVKYSPTVTNNKVTKPK